MRRTLSILIENKPGALARVVGLFHQRGYNIETLNVGPVFDGSFSRMTVTTRGSENDVEQITKQINKIILNARNHVIEFYAKSGYKAVRKYEGSDTGIPHTTMEKIL